MRLTWSVPPHDAQGMALRWWEGYAWTEYDCRVEHFAIVPLNWVIGWWERWGRYALRRGYRDSLWQDAFSLGYLQGYCGGYKDGEKRGDQKARAELSTDADRFLEEQKPKRDA